jgi:hypothetical protein
VETVCSTGAELDVGVDVGKMFREERLTRSRKGTSFYALMLEGSAMVA